MEREYGDVYERLYKEHWWWRAREEFLLNQIRSFELPSQPRILDVGCGNGLFFPELERLGGRVEGIESDAHLVTQSSQGACIHIGPFDPTFKPNHRFSLILMLDVLEHMHAPEQALVYAAELLEPEGYLVITVPAFRWLWTSHDDINHHVTRYTKKSLQQAALKSSLNFVRFQYFFHWLVFPKLCVHCKETCVRTRPKPPRVPSPFVNRTVLALSRIEQKSWGRWSLPVGSSLLAIARKSELA